MGEERRIERLEFELAEAGTDILDLRKQLAEALADCAATSYKLSEAFDELVVYELQLADARAEIERRNNGHDLLFSTFSQLREEHEMLKTELAERGRLIEQMKKLLKAVECSEFEGPICFDVDGKNWFDAREAALAAAERGGK